MLKQTWVPPPPLSGFFSGWSTLSHSATAHCRVCLPTPAHNGIEVISSNIHTVATQKKKTYDSIENIISAVEKHFQWTVSHCEIIGVNSKPLSQSKIMHLALESRI